jgi:regulation of enolase protein 1 (concanavalin A-like superfamily)
MPPDRSSFSALNLPSTFSLPPCLDYFTLSAGPNTNLWRKPPNGETSTAPIVFTSLRRPFVVAEVTVSADWEMEWDQGGLVIFAGAPPGQPLPAEPVTAIRSGRVSRNASSSYVCKWVKAGMEFSSGTVNASSVSATADGADWCLSPLAMPNLPTNITSLRIKLERIGHSLWIWYQIPSLSPYAVTPGAVGSTWKKLREVTWFFYGVEDKCVHVGVYASRPTSISRGATVWESMNSFRTDNSGSSDTLMVEFEDLEIF